MRFSSSPRKSFLPSPFSLLAVLAVLSFASCQPSVSPGTTTTPSTDATLSALSLSSGALSPKFASDTISYKAIVANSVASVTVAATAANSGATVSGTGAKSLAEGANTISVVVTAADAKTTKTYTITVTRAPTGASNDATLSALSLSNGTTALVLSPIFASGMASYAASVDNTVSSLTVAATATNSGALVSGTGITSLSVGVNKIDVIVTAADGTSATYTITVTRPASLSDYVGTWTGNTGGLTPLACTLIVQSGGAFTVKKTQGTAEQTIQGTTTVDATSGAATFNGTSLTMTIPYTYTYTESTETLEIMGSSYTRSSGTKGSIVGDWTNGDTLKIANDYTFTVTDSDGNIQFQGMADTSTSTVTGSSTVSQSSTGTINFSANPHTLIYQSMTLTKQ